MPQFETHEVRLSELIKHYIANLEAPEGWEILAIDLFTDVLVLKREVPEKEVEEDGAQHVSSSVDPINVEVMQTHEVQESQLNEKQGQHKPALKKLTQ
jgi:hypothetical protein